MLLKFLHFYYYYFLGKTITVLNKSAAFVGSKKSKELALIDLLPFLRKGVWQANSSSYVWNKPDYWLAVQAVVCLVFIASCRNLDWSWESVLDHKNTPSSVPNETHTERLSPALSPWSTPIPCYWVKNHAPVCTSNRPLKSSPPGLAHASPVLEHALCVKNDPHDCLTFHLPCMCCPSPQNKAISGKLNKS